MKILILFLSTIMSFLSFSQYEDEDNKFQISIRGKAYAGPTSPENNYGQMWTTGIELKFLNFHSIGADYVYFRDAYEHESLSPSGYYNNNGEYDITYRNYLNFDYRLYFKRNRLGKFPYFNIFTKIGKEKQRFDNGTIEKEEDIPFNFNAHFNEYGLALGSRFSFGTKGIIGLDVNLGVIYAKYFIYSFQPSPISTNFVYNYKKNTWKPHMRINLYINLFKID